MPLCNEVARAARRRGDLTNSRIRGGLNDEKKPRKTYCLTWQELC